MIDNKNISTIFIALDRQITIYGKKPISLVVCGGTALSALGLVSRTTKDVDVLGELFYKNNHIHIKRIVDFPEWFKSCASIIQRDFNLTNNWINTGPSSQVDSGLPTHFEDRLIKKEFGRYLTIYFISRYDQIHFKLYASVDRGGYHVEDLLKLNPTNEEIDSAAKWVITQDDSEGFKILLKDFLSKIGFHETAKLL